MGSPTCRAPRCRSNAPPNRHAALGVSCPRRSARMHSFFEFIDLQVEVLSAEYQPDVAVVRGDFSAAADNFLRDGAEDANCVTDRCFREVQWRFPVGAKSSKPVVILPSFAARLSCSFGDRVELRQSHLARRTSSSGTQTSKASGARSRRRASASTSWKVDGWLILDKPKRRGQ
jgi:hypothetical protein